MIQTPLNRAVVKKVSHKYCQNIIQSTFDAILVMWQDSIIYHNPRILEMIEYTSDQLLSKPWIGFIYPDDRDAMVTIFLQANHGQSNDSNHIFRILSGRPCKSGCH